MKLNEYSANLALTAPDFDPVDPLEQTQQLPVAERRYRQREARGMVARAFLYVPDDVQRQVDAQVDRLAATAGWPDFRDGSREHRLTVHEIAQQDGFPND